MTAENDAAVGPSSENHEAPRAAFSVLAVLKNRSDFVATARGVRASSKGLNLQGRDRGDDQPARVGFTATKKVGNAVARNRAKRRMRALAQEHLTSEAKTGWDYVLVARPNTTGARDWSDLCSDFRAALSYIHRSAK